MQHPGVEAAGDRVDAVGQGDVIERAVDTVLAQGDHHVRSEGTQDRHEGGVEAGIADLGQAAIGKFEKAVEADAEGAACVANFRAAEARELRRRALGATIASGLAARRTDDAHVETRLRTLRQQCPGGVGFVVGVREEAEDARDGDRRDGVGHRISAAPGAAAGFG